jgi:hypothetical protein
MADVYAPTALVTGLIHNILLHNKSGVSAQVDISFYDAASSLSYSLYALTVASGDTVNLGYYNEGLIVPGGCRLRARSAADAVNMKVDGTEETTT